MWTLYFSNCIQMYHNCKVFAEIYKKNINLCFIFTFLIILISFVNYLLSIKYQYKFCPIYVSLWMKKNNRNNSWFVTNSFQFSLVCFKVILLLLWISKRLVYNIVWSLWYHMICSWFFECNTPKVILVLDSKLACQSRNLKTSF